MDFELRLGVTLEGFSIIELLLIARPTTSDEEGAIMETLGMFLYTMNDLKFCKGERLLAALLSFVGLGGDGGVK